MSSSARLCASPKGPTKVILRAVLEAWEGAWWSPPKLDPHLLTRLHRCGEGCHRVHSPRGAALHLPDHLCGPSAAHDGVRARAGQGQEGGC